MAERERYGGATGQDRCLAGRFLQGGTESRCRRSRRRRGCRWGGGRGYSCAAVRRVVCGSHVVPAGHGVRVPHPGRRCQPRPPRRPATGVGRGKRPGRRRSGWRRCGPATSITSHCRCDEPGVGEVTVRRALAAPAPALRGDLTGIRRDQLWPSGTCGVRLQRAGRCAR
jgi:hypothetical protein